MKAGCKKALKDKSREGLDYIYAANELLKTDEHTRVVRMLLDKANDTFFELHEEITELPET